MRVLHIEDDAATAQSVELMMKSEGLNVYRAEDGEEGVDLASIYDYDLILLDLGLPDISGHEVLRRIRAARVKTPVMIVSGQSDVETKVRTLDAGADDYLVKPFHKDELVARSLSIIRRSKGHAAATIQVGPIAVNLDQKSVSVNDKPVALTGKEYLIIELLALRLGQTITKEMFLNHLYGGMDEPEIKIIDVFICKVRTKLRQAEVGQDRVQKSGTAASLVGKTLAHLATAPNRTHRRETMAATLGVNMNQMLTALKQLRGRGWAESQGPKNATTWSITPAGIRENSSRHTLAEAA